MPSALVSIVVAPVCTFTNNRQVFTIPISTSAFSIYFFFSLVVLTGVRLNLNVVLICISLTNNKDQLLWKSLRHFYFFPWFWEVNLRSCLKFKFNWLIYFLGISLYIHHIFIYIICYMYIIYVICFICMLYVICIF